MTSKMIPSVPARPGGRFPLAILLGSLLAWLGVGAPLAHGAAASEYELKAAFLFNFARFVEWPAGVLPADGQPIIIGIVGNDPFGESLDRIVSGEVINGRTLLVRRFNPRDDVTNCQILYIGRSEATHLPALLERLKGRSILTVSDADRFAYLGGMIGLVVEGGRVRIQINLDRARDAQLSISAKLLRPALVIRDHPQSMLPSRWGVYAMSPDLHRRRGFRRTA